MKRLLLAFTFALLWSGIAWAEIETKSVEYHHEDARLLGYLAYPKDADASRPGVLLVPEWWGLNEYVKRRTEQLAELGYVAFAADIYGDGQTTTDPDQASTLTKRFRSDRSLLRSRVAAGLETLKAQDLTDKARLAAIGYCFGGGAVLELARSGADIAGVVSFHGNLDTPHPEDAKNIQAQILVLHGGNDPFVPWEQVKDFIDEMHQAEVMWQMNIYGGAVHSFTNPAAGDDPTKGTAYHPVADRRSWADMQQFFDELFKE